MKLSVKLDASEDRRHLKLDTKEDFGLTDEEWNNLSSEEKKSLIQKDADNLPEQPYWIVDDFDESED